MNQDTIITKALNVTYNELNNEKIWRSKRPRDWNSVVLVTEGTLIHRSDHGDFSFPAGTVFVVPYNEWEIAFPDGDCVSYFYADYNCDPPALEIESVRIEHTLLYREQFETLVNIRMMRNPGWKFKCMELLYAIMNRFSCDQAHISGNDKKHRKILPALLKIAMDFAEPLDCTMLAELCGISVSSLNRLFREITGRSTMQYLFDTRIEYAKKELTQGTVKIGELTERCGFADIYTFSHAFKRATGVAPSEWSSE